MLIRALLVGALVGVVSCNPGEEFETDSGLSLVDHTRWELVAPEEDPFWNTVVDPILCPEAAYGIEGFGTISFYEVETTACNYLTVVQPSIEAVEPGDTLKASLWHLPLAALEPAQAKLYVSIASEVLLEKDISIPGKEEVYTPTIVADFSAPAGSPIVFHVHNHGANSWRFHKLTVTR